MLKKHSNFKNKCFSVWSKEPTLLNITNLILFAVNDSRNLNHVNKVYPIVLAPASYREPFDVLITLLKIFVVCFNCGHDCGRNVKKRKKVSN